jgi:hypothetical protein
MIVSEDEIHVHNDDPKPLEERYLTKKDDENLRKCHSFDSVIAIHINIL